MLWVGGCHKSLAGDWAGVQWEGAPEREGSGPHKDLSASHRDSLGAVLPESRGLGFGLPRGEAVPREEA